MAWRSSRRTWPKTLSPATSRSQGRVLRRPVIVVGDDVIVGFDRGRLKRLLEV
jgi:hypothetical protein